jgi:uncharacterized membrane protein YfcA
MYALVAATFFIAGGVKGVIGLGLPSVSLALLTATLGLYEAMAILLVPSFVTNLWQAVVGGELRAILARTWPFMAAATITVWLGALALTRVHVAWLSALLGVLLLAYSVLSLTRPAIAIPRRAQRWAGPVLGTANGVLTGMTGSFVVPGVLYLQALGLPRDTLVQAMGVLFTLSTVALAVCLRERELLSADLGLISAVAVAPALLGMVAGQRVRSRLSEARFRTVFFIALGAMGLAIVARSLPL